ncbi:MAG: amino acid permease [Verrucomicrobiales bacterium]|nr:MAG: amino acid permease [Verrucomicrobiales bacterium]
MPGETRQQPQLKRVIGLPGAMMMGLGSIIGTGVFVSLGIGAGIAGPSVLLAIMLAAGVAMCNGLSSAQLAANHPVSGGTYEYGHRWLNPSLGFTAGWMFLCAKSASAATAALGFAGYIAHATGMGASLPLAVGVVVLVTVIALSGIERSNRVNIVIVSIVILALMIFVGTGFSSAVKNKAAFQPLFDGGKPTDLLQATALMFVAFTGYGRIATLGEEVAEPRRTIPRAVIVTLLISMALYLSVAFVGIGVNGFENPDGSLALASKSVNNAALPTVMLVGATVAMVSVLLNLVLGLSRVVLAMGRRGDLPKATARISESTSVPAVATVGVAVLIAGLVCVGDVKLTWSFSAFTVLVYYAITNLCAIRMKPGERLYPIWPAYLGLAACLTLAFFVDWEIWLTGLGLIIIGLAWRACFNR